MDNKLKEIMATHNANFGETSWGIPTIEAIAAIKQVFLEMESLKDELPQYGGDKWAYEEPVARNELRLAIRKEVNHDIEA